MPGLRGFRTGLLALSLLGCTAQAVPPLPVHVGGRAIRNADGSLTFGWPAVYIEGRFRGTGVSVAVETQTDRLRLLIDGVQRGMLEPGSTSLTVSGLPSGNHLIRLEKLSESQAGGTRFIGFYPSDSSKPLPAPPESRLEIEYIGDSHSVGYGDLSTSRDCTGQQVHDTTDSQQAFGPLLARRFGADYRVIAYSGRGIVRNYNGGPGESLPSLYPRMKPDDGTDLEREPGSWHPQLIVINLGTNDFSTPVHPGEAWPNDSALRADYRDKYAAFARMLMAKQPQAHLVLMGGDNFQAEVEHIATALNGERPGRALTLPAGPMEHTGCHYHPSLKDQKMMADGLQSLLERHPEIWARGEIAKAARIDRR